MASELISFLGGPFDNQSRPREVIPLIQGRAWIKGKTATAGQQPTDGYFVYRMIGPDVGKFEGFTDATQVTGALAKDLARFEARP